jgi:hypothetical protein
LYNSYLHNLMPQTELGDQRFWLQYKPAKQAQWQAHTAYQPLIAPFGLA